jgi:hypothetical protein
MWVGGARRGWVEAKKSGREGAKVGGGKKTLKEHKSFESLLSYSLPETNKYVSNKKY